uniref:Uncharacterized protein n=1 Tax=Anguilla anguilla TaxID=7936 RepID=A0A0E9V0W7_ANGAN
MDVGKKKIQLTWHWGSSVLVTALVVGLVAECVCCRRLRYSAEMGTGFISFLLFTGVTLDLPP